MEFGSCVDSGGFGRIQIWGSITVLLFCCDLEGEEAVCFMQLWVLDFCDVGSKRYGQV